MQRAIGAGGRYGFRYLTDEHLQTIERVQSIVNSRLEDPFDCDQIVPVTLADFECEHGALPTDTHKRCGCFKR